MNIEKSEIIDAYLREELSSKDLQAFEKQLSADPALIEEVKFQRSVVAGLGHYRKAELISRLNAIDVTVPWWQVGQFVNPAILKTAGALFTATIIGTGVYFYTEYADIPEVKPTVTVQDVVSAPQLLFNQKGSGIKLSEPLVVDRKAFAKSSIERGSGADLKAEPTIEEEIKAESSASLSGGKTGSDFVPDVALPNPGDGAEGSHFTTESVEIPLASKTDIINAGKLDIKTTQRNSDVIRYKYYDGKLHLYGNFKETPYEILEINRKDSKVVYLFHDHKYFKLLTTDKIIDLPQITDRELIHELEIVRNNKVD